MEARGEPQHATQDLLADFRGNSQFCSVQHDNDNTVNVYLDSAYALIEKVMDEIREIHRQTQSPSHALSYWCRRNRRCLAGLSDTQQLVVCFIECVTAMLASKNMEIAAGR